MRLDHLDPSKDIIRLPKSCEIKNIAELRSVMLSAITQGSASILDGSDVESADFSFVQLVVSASASAEPGAPAFELRNPAPCIRSAFSRAGLAGFHCLANEV